MRGLTLGIALAALLGVVALFLQSEGAAVRRDGAHEADRWEQIDARLSQLQRDVEDLKAGGPRLLSAQGTAPDQAGALEEIRAEIARLRTEVRADLSAEPGSAPTADKKPEEAPKAPADPAEVSRWLAGLESEDEDIVFSSTIELARLGDLRATDSLVRILQTHRDFYSRLGAATALGELKAVGSVPSLIEALNDKDELVRTASKEALLRVTGKDFGFLGNMGEEKRHEIQDKYRVWWREHADEVGERLGQVR